MTADRIGRAPGRPPTPRHLLWGAAAVPPRGTPLPDAPPPRPRSSFVGRTAEIARLTKMLGAARRGEGQIAVIEGSAGIGKTRLAEEVAWRAPRRGAPGGVG